MAEPKTTNSRCRYGTMQEDRKYKDYTSIPPSVTCFFTGHTMKIWKQHWAVKKDAGMELLV